MSRACGACSACCHVLGVVALDKPEWSPCSHQAAAGCAIYEDRPDGCKTYRCAWLDGKLNDDERPDLVGLIVDSGLTKSFLPIWGADAVNVREVLPDSAMTRRGVDLVDRLVDEGRPVFLKFYGGGVAFRSHDAKARAAFGGLLRMMTTEGEGNFSGA